MVLWRVFFPSILGSVILTILSVSLFGVVDAQVRTSNNYQIISDSINMGGGLSSSTSYVQESTVGEIATGLSSSTAYSLRAGYQQMQEVFLSLAVTGDVTMSPDLPGITGGMANGSTTFTVITDSPSGYQMTIQAENNPAMQNGAYTIADYDDGGTPDYSFITGSAQAHLGFTPEGNDITQEFLDDGAGTCGIDTNDTGLACWDGLSTTERIIAQGSGSNHPSGATTTVYFRVGIGSGAGVVPGVYTATTTVTALPL